MMTQEILNVALIQMEQRQCDVAWNISHLHDLLAREPMEGVDLLLLPEMWTTGFVTIDEEGIEGAYDKGREAMRKLSERYGCAVYGSLLRKTESGRLANAGVFMDVNEGMEAEYHKVHLFGPGGEAKYFLAGDKRCVVSWRGWDILLTICYDLRFPVWMRYSAELPYDLILCCANWPRPRQDAWKMLLRARAIDNQAYVLGCNRVGAGPKGLVYTGDSILSDPKGELLHDVIEGQEAVLRATLDLGKLRHFRTGFPVLADADPFTLLDR